MTDPTASIDADALSRYLSDHLDGFRGPLEISKFPTGQSNPTYRIVSPSGSYVLRRRPTGPLLKSAHAVDREFRVIRALRETAVPVPEAHVLCEDDGVIGSMFYVMSFVDGRSLLDPCIPELGDNRAARASHYDAMNRTLAAIHNVDIDAANLRDFGKPGNYFERQVQRWTKQYRSTVSDPSPDMERLATWLGTNMPADDGRTSLVHGDFRIDNLIFAPSGSEVHAVLDWELATLGHPFADLAFQCMQWRLPVDSPLPGLSGVDRDAFGIPSEDDYVAQYCRRMGCDGISNWPFYLVFSFFRLAAILEGVRRRAREGNASNPDLALKFGAMVPMLVSKAMGIIAEQRDD